MNPLYTEADYSAISQQIRKRWSVLLAPVTLLLFLIVFSFMCRIEWLTTTCTILLGVLLIAGYDLAIKPLNQYQQLLDNCLHGRTRECDLPFLRRSEDIDVVDGVRCHQLFCSDTDAKGRPYERLFYFDAEKELPPAKEGDMLHIVHHDLHVANLYRL